MRYAILESPQRWWIMAGLAFGAAIIGTIFIFAFEWSHVVGRIWLYGWLLVTLALLVAGAADWKDRMQEAIRAAEEAEVKRAARRAD
jgi:hypothetical protein